MADFQGMPILNATETLAWIQRGVGRQLDAIFGTVDAAVAKYLFDTRCPNRLVSRVNIAKIKRAISDKKWMLNGEPIILNDEGKMLDGQNRCMAVMEANEEIHVVIVTGIDSEAFKTMDLGAKRTAAHILAMSGEKDSTTLGGAVRLHWRIAHDQMTTVASQLADYEVLDYLNEQPGIRSALSWGQLVRRFIPKSVGAGLFHAFSLQNMALAKDFYSTLASGENLTKQDTIYHMRDLCLFRRELRQAKARTSAEHHAASMILAWRSLVFKRPIRSRNPLMWQHEQGEAFPRIPGNK